MDAIELLRLNLLSPMVLAFVLGMVAALVRSDLRFPDALYDALTMYLLLAIGLKGGAALSEAPFSLVWSGIAATLVVGVVTPAIAYGAARGVIRFTVPDASALAAHYGSVSAVTFIAALVFLDAAGVAREGFMPALVVVLEVPAIVMALMIARRAVGLRGSWGGVAHEVLTGRSVLLLLGGLAIGFAAGPRGVAPVDAFFVAPFLGVLTLFMLDMGLNAARRFRELDRRAFGLVAFAIVIPLVNAVIGAVAGKLAGLSVGGTMVMATMAASASYIAAPAAVRIALPQANPALYLTAVLAVTFPFNIAIGLPLYLGLARWLHGG